MSDPNEKARRDAFEERNEGRRLLSNMLDEPGLGGLSEERVAALQEIFKKRKPSSMPRSERGLAKDQRTRLEGLAEMALARVRHTVTEDMEEEKVVNEELERVSDGLTMSHSLNGKPCTKEELEEGYLPGETIKERCEQSHGPLGPVRKAMFGDQLQGKQKKG